MHHPPAHSTGRETKPGRFLVRHGRWLPPLLAFVGLARLSWRGWAHPFIDFGREAYAAWRLSSGDLLYKDLAWFNGPFSAYLNAGAFRLFGADLGTLFWTSLCIAALAAVLVYVTVARAFGQLGGWLGLMTFLLVFVFGHLGGANYNWVAPYSHELPQGVTLSLAALLAMDAADQDRKRTNRWRFVAGALLGLVALTKVEATLALGLGLLVMHALRSDRTWRGLAFLCAGFATVAAPTVVLSAALYGPANALGPLLDPWRFAAVGEVRLLPFYARGMGLEAPWVHLGAACLGLFTYLVALAVAASVDVATRRRPLLSFGLTVVGFLAWFFLAVLALPPVFPWMLNGLPLFLVAILAILLWGPTAGRDPSSMGHRSLAVGLTVFALALLGKMFLNARLHGYGFALAMPATVVVTAFLGGEAVSLVRARWGGTGAQARALALSLTVFLWASAVVVAVDRYGSKEWTMGSGADRIRTDERGAVIDAALARISELNPRSMVVLPEGVMLNYMARIPNPTRYVSFIPPELILFGERNMIESLEASPPDLVVLVHRDASVYGLPFFGEHFGTGLDAWVREHYRLDRRFGREPFQGPRERFGIDVMVPRAGIAVVDAPAS